MNLNVGDEVVIDVRSEEGDSYSGPGVVDSIYPRGCFVDAGSTEGLWWVPLRVWGTDLQRG